MMVTIDMAIYGPLTFILWQLLEDSMNRCVAEATLQRRYGGGRQNRTIVDALFSLTQGVPATAKRQLLKWIAIFFEEFLKGG